MSFFDAAYPYALRAHNATGVCTSVLLAQCADETGYGGYDWSVAHNPGNVGSFDGQPVNQFPSLDAGTDAWIQCMNNGYYNAVKAAVGWQAQCYALGASPWASGHYNAAGGPPGQDLVAIVQRENLTRFDQAPAPVPSKPPPVVTEGRFGLFCTDPTSKCIIATDVHGNFYARFGKWNGAIVTLPEHPELGAGNALDPCVGIVMEADNGVWGYTYICAPLNGKGGFGPYNLYHVPRNGF